jgi:hypothetical protein
MPNFPFMIGKGAALGSNYAGLLDDIGVWKRALSIEEINELIDLDKFKFQAFTGIEWSTGDFASTINVYPTESQEFWVSKEIDGCFYTDTFNVSIARISASDSVICKGELTSLIAAGWNSNNSASLVWSTGDTVSNITVQPNVSTWYYLNSTVDNVNCMDSIQIVVNDPTISLNANAYCIGDTAILSSVEMEFPTILSNNSSLNDSLLIWLPFNNSIIDESGNNIGLNLTDCVLGDDRNGGKNASLSLGGNGYISTDSALIVGQHPMTFSFWALSNSAASQDIMGQFCGTDCGSDIRIQLNTAQCGSQGLGFKSPAHFALAPKAYDTAWHHYAIVMGDGGSFSYQYFKFYIDGVLVSTSCGHNWGGWTYSMPNFPFMIGKGAALGSNYAGLLDDIGVWKRALSVEEINELMSVSSNSNGFKTFLWSTGETTPSIQIVSDTTETVWLKTNFLNQECFDTIQVIRSIPEADISKSILSNPQTTNVELSALMGYSYNWSNGATSRIINTYPLATTNYWLTVTDSIGCVSSDTLVIEVVDVTFRLNLIGQSIDTLSGVHVVGNFQNWNPITSEMIISNSNIYEYTTGLVVGDSAIQYKFINGNSWNAPHDFVTGSCASGAFGDRTYIVPDHNDTLPIVQLSSCGDYSPIDVLPDVQSAKCPSSTKTLSAGNSVWNVVWNTGDTASSITVSSPGTYYFSANYYAGFPGINVYDTTIVVNHPLPDTTISVTGSLNFCEGSSVSFSGVQGQSYLWNTGDTNRSISISQSGSYYALITTPEGCIDTTDTFNVTVYPDSDTTISILGSLSFCAGGSVTLSAASGQSYLWNTGDTTQSITTNQSGSYYAVVTTSDGCSDTTATYTSLLYSDPDTSVAVTGSLSFCPGGSVTLSATAGQSYLWSNGDTTQSITTTQSGTYYAIITTADGCSDTTAQFSTTAFVGPNTTITASQTTICASDSTVITAAAGYSYLWNTGDTTQSITTSNAGTYSVTLTTTDGCIDSSAHMVIVVVPDIVLPPIIGNTWGWFGQGDTTNLSTATNASYTLTWVVNGGTILSGQGTDNIQVVWGGPDSNAVVWLYIDNGVCMDSSSIQVIISGIGTDERTIQDIRLFPNPNDGFFTLQVSDAFVGGYYEIVDGMGRPIERGEIQSKTQDFDLADKPKGVYRITLTGKSASKTMIVVLQ